MTSRKTVALSAALLTAFAGAASAGTALTGPNLAGYARAPGPQDGDVIGEVSQTSLYLRTGVVDASQPRAGLAELAGSRGRFVVQLDGPMTPQRRAALEGAGVRIGDYLPINSFVVDLSGADADGLAGLGFVRWHSVFQNSWKLAPDLGSREASTNDRLFLQGLGLTAVFIDVFIDADVGEAIDAVHAIDDRAEVGYVGMVGNQAQLHAVVPTELLAGLSEIDGVQFVEDAPEFTTRNSSTRWIVQSNVSGETPLYDNGIRGEGQILGLMDGRLDPNHCSFTDPEGDPFGPDHRKIEAYNTSTGADSHGTHCGGTAVGDAGADSHTRGMAYMAKLTYHLIPFFNESALYNRLVQHEGQGARVHSNSWGNDGTTSYDGTTRAIDRFSYDYEDNLVAFAVTNQSLLKNPENAKNVLAVGATQDTPNQNSHCSGGRGPTSDGRRKPEIYAPGCSTNSSRAGTSCSTRALTGTSMACPAISGVGLMVRQYYTDGYYPSGSANGPDGFVPSGALIKGTLINGSVDMTGVSGYPSDREGWGRLVADYALHFDGDIRTMWATDVRNASGLDTSEVVEYPIEVTGSGEQLRVTMVFTDPPAAANANFAPINDLDLEVVSPGGDTYRGNFFSGGESASGGIKDDRNNLEQVHVSSPETGTWTVRVNAAAVNVGAQGYALVATGEIAGAGGCVADFNGDGDVNTLDVLAFLNAYAAGDASADINGDGTVNTLDVIEFLNLWNEGC